MHVLSKSTEISLKCSCLTEIDGHCVEHEMNKIEFFANFYLVLQI